MHAHGANDRSISFVIEVGRLMPENASPAEIAAASKAQPQLPLQDYLGDWDAAVEDFRGPILKFCFGGGGGSTRRVVIHSLRGLKQGRGKRRPGMSLREARAAVNKMSEEELKERASAWMRLIGAPAALAALTLTLTPTPTLTLTFITLSHRVHFTYLQASSSRRRSCRRRWTRWSRRAGTCARTRRRRGRACRSPSSRPRVRPRQH